MPMCKVSSAGRNTSGVQARGSKRFAQAQRAPHRSARGAAGRVALSAPPLLPLCPSPPLPSHPSFFYLTPPPFPSPRPTHRSPPLAGPLTLLRCNSRQMHAACAVAIVLLYGVWLLRAGERLHTGRV